MIYIMQLARNRQLESGSSSSVDEPSTVSPSQANRQESPDNVSTCNEGILFKDNVSGYIFSSKSFLFTPPSSFLK